MTQYFGININPSNVENSANDSSIIGLPLSSKKSDFLTDEKSSNQLLSDPLNSNKEKIPYPNEKNELMNNYFNNSNTKVGNITILNISSALDGCDEQLLPASFRALEMQLKLHPSELGKIAFAQSILMSLSCPIWGYLADTYSRKKIMTIGMISWGIATILLGFASSLHHIIILRMINGIFLGSMGPISQSVLSDIAPSDFRGLNFGILQLFTNFGRILGGVVTTSIGALYIFNIMGWRFCFIFVGCFSCLLGIIIELFVGEFTRKPLKEPTTNTSIHNALAGTGGTTHINNIMDDDLGVIENTSPESNFTGQLSYPTLTTIHPENDTSNLTTVNFFFKGLIKNLTIPSVFILLIEGMVGTIPWSSLAFITMFFQYAGLNDVESGIVTGSLLLGAMIGSPVGGLIGDYISLRNPNHGRILLGQMCIMLRLPLLYTVFEIITKSSKSFLYYSLSGFSIGLLSVGGVIVNRPLLSEIVPQDQKASIFAVIIATEGIFASVLGAPVVGILAETMFGYIRTTQSVEAIPVATRIINATAISRALLYLTCIPWCISVIVYSFLHITYAKDRSQFSSQS